jgi:hypothetical protein
MGDGVEALGTDGSLTLVVLEGGRPARTFLAMDGRRRIEQRTAGTCRQSIRGGAGA